MKKLEEADIEYTSMIRHFLFEGMNGEIGPSSAGIEKMIEMFGLTASDMDGMDETALCRKWESYECIRKSFLQVEGENTMSEEQKDVLDWYNNTSLIDPCSGEEIPIDVDDHADQLCMGCIPGIEGGLTPENLEKVYDMDLEDLPPVISISLSENCPKIACVINELISPSDFSSFGTNFICEMMDKLSESQYNFGFVSKMPKSGEPPFLGKVTVTPDNKSIAIIFNPDFCNSMDGIQLFETIQHELIHADLFRRQLQDYGLNALDPQSIEQSFTALVKAKYGNSASQDHHQLMLNELLPDILNSLMRANGSNQTCTGVEQSGDCYYFKTMVLNGFSEEYLENNFGISLDLHRQNYASYNLWKLTQPLYQNVNNCQ